MKAVLGRHFSLTIFGFAQVAIDLETLIRLLRGDAIRHGYSHTYLGATIIALLTLALGRPICQGMLDRWIPSVNSRSLTWLRGPSVITWTAAITGAFSGTYSHRALDSIMHVDMQPYWPCADGNDLLGLVSIDRLHQLCIESGVLGLLCLGGVSLLLGRRGAKGNASSGS